MNRYDDCMIASQTSDELKNEIQTEEGVWINFLPGDGTRIKCFVAYVADFPRTVLGHCAFCQGDPWAECSETEATAAIHNYMERNKSWATSCPFCDGRAS